jgi:hypothetical protein
MRSPVRRILASTILALAAAAPAFPWAKEGHEAMAMAAQRNLSDEARSHVVKILGSDDLASIAVWMDDVRSAYFRQGPLADDPEALKFNAEFPHNGEWHYVDMPLGTKAYALDAPTASPHDVVHMAEEAVRVLEGGGDKRITQLEALRMLVHFVGDMHQPLHVGNGFFAIGANGVATLVTDPAAVATLPNDKGGNALFFGPGRYDELHAYWDADLVQKMASTKDAAVLAPVLERQIAAQGASWKSAGDYHHWPEQWATESVEAARTAYAGLEYGEVTPDPKGGFRKIQIKFPANYDQVCIPLAQERLAKSGYHLAEILNAIKWAD